jgi:hypothetical protein
VEAKRGLSLYRGVSSERKRGRAEEIVRHRRRVPFETAFGAVIRFSKKGPIEEQALHYIAGRGKPESAILDERLWGMENLKKTLRSPYASRSFSDREGWTYYFYRLYDLPSDTPGGEKRKALHVVIAKPVRKEKNRSRRGHHSVEFVVKTQYVDIGPKVVDKVHALSNNGNYQGHPVETLDTQKNWAMMPDGITALTDSPGAEATGARYDDHSTSPAEVKGSGGESFEKFSQSAARRKRFSGVPDMDSLMDWARESVRKSRVFRAGEAAKNMVAVKRYQRLAHDALVAAASAPDAKARAEQLRLAREYLNLQAYNVAVAVARQDAQAHVDRDNEWARAIWEDRYSEDLRRAIGDPALEQIRKVMARFGFGGQKARQAVLREQTDSLSDWVTSTSAGSSIFPGFVLNENNFRRQWHELTYGEFVDVVDALHIMFRIGESTTRIAFENREVEYEKLVGELIEDVIAKYGEKAVDIDPNVKSSRVKKFLRGYFSDLTAIEFMMRQMDKYQDLGLWWTAIFKRIADAESEEIKLKAEMVSGIKALFGALGYVKKDWSQKYVTRIQNPATGNSISLTKENIMSIALNWGTKKNRQRIIGGLFVNEEQTREAAAKEDGVSVSSWRCLWLWL